MLISEKQLLMLIKILDDSLQFEVNTYRFDHKTRANLFSEITNQQSTKLYDVDPDEEVK